MSICLGKTYSLIGLVFLLMGYMGLASAQAAPLPVASVTASGYEVLANEPDRVPQNTLDNDLTTRWSAEGDGQWIRYDFGAPKTVNEVQIAWYRGDLRTASFKIDVSMDATAWTEVFKGQSSGTTLNFQSYKFPAVTARYVRITGFGNTENAWNSLNEVDIYGSDATAQPPTANAGPDKTVNKYTSVSLNASASTNVTSYKWTQTEGPTVSLSDNQSAILVFTPVSAATYKFLLEVSNTGGSDTDEVVVVAQDISTISIVMPTADDAITVSQSPIELAGLAGEHISSVIVTNKATGSTFTGQLDGNGGFSVQGIVLVEGDNKLEAVGTDNTGALTKDNLLVTYNQNVNYLSSPSFSVDSAFVNETTETVVSIAIEENQNIIPNGVTLVALNNAGTVIPENIATLYDNGDVSNGDDIAGDGVYSTKTTITKPNTGVYNYRVSVNTGIVSYSSPVSFPVLIPVTNEQIKSANDKTQTAFNQNFPAPGSKFTQTQFKTFRDKIVFDLSSLQEVVNANLSADGNSIVAKYNSGLIHTIDFVYAVAGTNFYTQNSNATDRTRNHQVTAKRQANIEYYNESRANLPMPNDFLYKNQPISGKETNLNDNSIGSYRALALSPFHWQFKPWDANDAYSILENSSNPTFNTEAKLIDYNVSVENFKNLSDYGVVMINSHGGLEGRQPVIYTGEEATPEKQKIYQKDIDARRLMISHKVTILIEDGGFLWFDSKEEKQVFKIAPSFITKYNSNMPNTLVYLGICNGISTDTLANAFLSAGAGAVVGFTDIVYTGYNYAATHTLLEEMVNGKTVNDAVASAITIHGANDSIWATTNEITDDNTPATFVYRGNGELVFERTSIQNGGFEENLKFWEENGGDVRILAKLSSLLPQEGSYMAILSSGLGSVSNSEAIITQQFKIPSGVSFLNFKYNVISEEPMEFTGSSFDDKFRAVLIDANGNEIELAYETVNTSTWTAINGSQADSGMFDGGDGTAFHTGWKTVNHPITSLAGQTVTLKFRVWDVGDSIYDTAALLDNIMVQ